MKLQTCLKLSISIAMLTMRVGYAQIQDNMIDDPGDIAIVSYHNDDGNDGQEDGFSFILLDDAPAGTTIRFIDEEWDGNAFVNTTGEGELLWENNTGSTIPAGTVVNLEDVDGDGETASIGTVDEVDLGFNLGATDHLFAITGTRAMPGIFLTFYGNTDPASGNVLTNTNLVDGTTAQINNSTNIQGRYTGNTTCNGTIADCATMFNTVANWTSGDFNHPNDVETEYSGSVLNTMDAKITIEDVSVNEDDGAITLTATLDIAVSGGLTVDISTTDGTATIADADYTAVSSQTLTFAGTAGETQTFTIIPIADAKVESDETITITMSNLTGTAATVDISDTATIEISNDDSSAITIDDIAGNEDDGPIILTATLDAAVEGGFSVDVRTQNGTATIDDNDYTAINGLELTFVGTAGETQTFEFRPTQDATVEEDETVTVSFSNLVSNTVPVSAIDISDTATVTITNDDQSLGNEGFLSPAEFQFINPVTNLIKIESKLNIESLTLYTLVGKQIQQTEGNKMSIDAIAPGLHLLKIKTQTGQTAFVRIVKR